MASGGGTVSAMTQTRTTQGDTQGAAPAADVAPARAPVGADADVLAIRRVANADRAALAELYERHAPLLLGLGIKMLRDRAEAEDILHTVFVEVWQRAGDYAPGRGSVRGWLALRMRSRCLDRLRRAEVRRRDDSEDATVAAIEPDDGAAVAELAIEGRRVREALKTLPDDERAVLLLGYFKGLSSTEIGTRLGIPSGTVKSRVRRGINSLRAALGGVR